MENNNNDINRNHNPQQQPPLTTHEEIKPQHRQKFLYQQMKAIENVKPHPFPLARIKKIMKFDRDVHKVSAEAPIIFAKACEMFILDLTLRSWLNVEDSKRRMLEKSDIATVVAQTYAFDFLLDVVPRDEPVVVSAPHVDPAADLRFVAMPQPDVGLPFNYPPGMVIENSVVGESEMFAPMQMPKWLEDWLEDVEEEKEGGEDVDGPSGRNTEGY